MNRPKKNILLTGLPGVGKTTIIRRLSEVLQNLHPVGFYTQEIREKGIRKGFELISLNGKKGLLSHVSIKSPYKVGKYLVDVKGFGDFVNSIDFFAPEIGLILIDEIGKMECLSPEFINIIRRLFDSEKIVIATIALKGSGLIEDIKRRDDIRLFEVTEKNRDYLVSEILSYLKQTFNYA